MSKIIRGDTLREGQRWDVPIVNAQTDPQTDSQPAGSGIVRHSAAVPAKELEALQKQAYQEGFELGKRDGVQAGKAALNTQIQALKQVFSTLEKPLKELDDQVVEELSILALTIARHIIRREIKTDPGQIIATIREALAELPVSSTRVRVYLNPEDVIVVKESLLNTEGEHSWELIDDPVLARGGCCVVTETSRIDASVETRLAAIMAQVMGGERGEDAHVSDES